MKSIKKPLLNEGVRLSEKSVDAQIDALLLGYQERSMHNESVDGELTDHFKLLLEEADEEDESVGDEQVKADQPALPKADQINIDNYAEKVYTLLINYKSLLNIEPVILNRAKAILKESGYNNKTLSELEEILEVEFGVSLDSEENDIPQPPVGGVSGPAT